MTPQVAVATLAIFKKAHTPRDAMLLLSLYPLSLLLVAFLESRGVK
jgi:hypothetical protein